MFHGSALGFQRVYVELMTGPLYGTVSTGRWARDDLLGKERWFFWSSNRLRTGWIRPNEASTIIGVAGPEQQDHYDLRGFKLWLELHVPWRMTICRPWLEKMEKSWASPAKPIGTVQIRGIGQKQRVLQPVLGQVQQMPAPCVDKEKFKLQFFILSDAWKLSR